MTTSHRLLLLAGVLATACGTPQPPGEETPPQVDTCAITGIPAEVSVSEGGRLRIPFTTTPAQTAVLVVDTGTARWSPTIEESGTLVVRPPYGSSGKGDGDARFVLRAHCADGTADATIHVIARPLVFEQLAPWSGGEGPPAREYGAMWIDEEADRLFVHGGFHYEPTHFTLAWDTWAMDLATGAWSAITPATAPPKLAGGRVAPVPGERAVLLYGGVADDNDSPYSLVRFDYAEDALRWTDEPLAAPWPRGDYTGAFIQDPKRNRYLSVCGANQLDGPHCNVSAYYPNGDEPGHWEWVETAIGDQPGGRYGFFFAYDEETDRVIVFSGQSDERDVIAQDTWALELGETPARWVRLSGGETPRPIGRRNGAYMLDPDGHRLFVWGGTPDGWETSPGLWVLPLGRGEETWQRVNVLGQPDERSSAMATWDAKRRRMIVGFGNTNEAVYADLWTLSL